MEKSPHFRQSYHRIRAEFYMAQYNQGMFDFHKQLQKQAEKEIKQLEKLEELNEMFRPHIN